MGEHWTHSVEAHKHGSAEAIAKAAWALAQEHGPLSVTMSDVAEAAGISRPTLYKYFPNVEAMLIAHHRSHVAAHLDHLTAIAEGPGDDAAKLDEVLNEYATICHMRAKHGADDVDRLVHTGFEVTAAEREVTQLLEVLIAGAAAAGAVRADAKPATLAAYCVRSLAAAADVPKDAVSALVDIVRSALRP